MKTKTRFPLNAVCRADGISAIYEASHKAHKDYLEREHRAFCFLGFSPKETVEPKELEANTPVWVTWCGKKHKVPYHIARDGGMTYTLY